MEKIERLELIYIDIYVEMDLLAECWSLLQRGSCYIRSGGCEFVSG